MWRLYQEYHLSIPSRFLAGDPTWSYLCTFILKFHLSITSEMSSEICWRLLNKLFRGIPPKNAYGDSSRNAIWGCLQEFPLIIPQKLVQGIPSPGINSGDCSKMPFCGFLQGFRMLFLHTYLNITFEDFYRIFFGWSLRIPIRRL